MDCTANLNSGTGRATKSLKRNLTTQLRAVAGTSVLQWILVFLFETTSITKVDNYNANNQSDVFIAQ